MSDQPLPSGPQFRADRPTEQDAVRTTIVGGRPPGSGQPVGPIPRGIEVLVKKASVDPAFRELLLTERAAAAERIGLELEPAEMLMLAAAPRDQLEAVIRQTTVPQTCGEPQAMNRQIPQGVEVLIRKASVDPEFKAILLERRARAAEAIGLELTGAEAMLLAAAPTEQIEAIIAQTTVPQEHRRAFLGQAAAAMLAALGAMGSGVAWAGGKFGGGAAGGVRPGDLGGTFGVRPDAPSPPGNRKSPDAPVQPTEEAPKPPTIEDRVVDLVARRFKMAAETVTADTAWVADLKATTGQLVRLRAELEKTFGVPISSAAFKKLKTVRQVVEYLETAIDAREQAKQKPPPQVPQQHPVSRGIRPDRPIGPLGGSRPDRPPGSQGASDKPKE